MLRFSFTHSMYASKELVPKIAALYTCFLPLTEGEGMCSLPERTTHNI